MVNDDHRVGVGLGSVAHSSSAAPPGDPSVETLAILYLQQRPPVSTQRRSATSIRAKYLS